MNCLLCKSQLSFLRPISYGCIYKCRYCRSEFIDAHQGKIRYNQSFFKSYTSVDSEFIADKKRNNFRNIFVNNFPTIKNIKILDIGCAQGFLLQTARSLGAREIYGIDTSKWVIEKARRNVPLGNFYCGQLKDAIENRFLKENNFDIVAGIDIIEHIADPRGFLYNVLKVLKSGGKGLFVTPNIDSYWRKFLGPLWFNYQREHLTFVSFKGLKILAKELKFKIDKFTSFKKTLPLGYVFSILKYHTEGFTRGMGTIGLGLASFFSIKKVDVTFSAGECLIIISKC